MVLRNDLKLSLGVLALGTSWKCGPKSAITCVLPGATQCEQQCNLIVAATFAELGGSQERTTCEPRLVANSVGPGSIQQEVVGMQRSEVAIFGGYRKFTA